MEGPVTTRIDAGPVALAVHDWGGDGPPVLLAHPTGFHGRLWAPVARRLVQVGRRVWSFDFRGHGDSDAPDEDYSWHGFAEDLLAVTDHLRLAGDPNLLACGHSKGGASLVLGEQRRPGTYARLWLFEPIILPIEEPLPPSDDNGLSRVARRRRNEWSSVDEAFASYGSRPPLDVMTEESLRAYVDYAFRDRGDGVLVLKCRPEIEARVYSMGSAHGAFARLGEVRVPTRIVVGETTDAITPEFGSRLVERLPRGSLEVMRGAGHFGPQQDPDGAVASMLAFADETATPP